MIVINEAKAFTCPSIAWEMWKYKLDYKNQEQFLMSRVTNKRIEKSIINKLIK